jgi:hypothetical protein
MINDNEKLFRAETAFKKKEQQARDSSEAWKEYQARTQLTLANAMRLREMRLSKEATDALLSAQEKEKLQVRRKTS